MDVLPARSILEVADCMFSSVAQGKSGSAKKARRKAAKGKDAELVPHYKVLACEYHISIVAGLALIGVPCAWRIIIQTFSRSCKLLLVSAVNCMEAYIVSAESKTSLHRCTTDSQWVCLVSQRCGRELIGLNSLWASCRADSGARSHCYKHRLCESKRPSVLMLDVGDALRSSGGQERARARRSAGHRLGRGRPADLPEQRLQLQCGLYGSG